MTRPRNTGRGQARGERMGNAKLTEAIVRRIRELRRANPRIGAKRVVEALAAEGIELKEGSVVGVLYQGHWRHVQ
jgi:hypothetical protein